MKQKVTMTKRSLDWLRGEGWTAAVVEQNIRIPDPASKGGWRMFKRDLFNFADICAIHPKELGTLYVQTTTMAHKGERKEKIEQSKEALTVIKAGNSIELHCWRQKGARGARKLWCLARYAARVHGGTEIHWIDLPSDGDGFEPEQQSLLAEAV